MEIIEQEIQNLSTDIKEQSATELHNESMDIAELAQLEQLKKNSQIAKEMFREALKLEALAAEKFVNQFDYQPTRSVLYRSAASLAVNCGEYEYAKKLALEGLMGTAPNEIKEEIRDILKECKKFI
jgi:hypothetical protein